MNDRLPYEDQLAKQGNDLPLPDENMAWEDMKRRLDEEDDDGIIPFWLRGCGLWSFLAILLLGLGWWLFRPDKWWNKKQMTESTQSITPKEDKKNNTHREDTLHILKNKDTDGTSIKRKTDSKNQPGDTSSIHAYPGRKRSLVRGKNGLSLKETIATSKKERTFNNSGGTVRKNTKDRKQPVPGKEKRQVGNEQANIIVQPGLKDKNASNNPPDTKTIPRTDTDSMKIVTTDATNKPDSIHKIPGDSIQKKNKTQTAKTNEQKKDSTKLKGISFSAGVALHQLLPIDGQKWTPYNSQGRKGSLADYIPAVYFRMYKNDKWFLQAEFRYGAPQYTKEFLYEQKSKFDSIGPGNSVTTTTSSRLKKTFYHQLPLTFNYFVLPNWSIGTGLVWNKFNSAISDRQVNKKNNSTQVDSLISDGIVKDKGDSNFAKSYFQAVFETQYRWRRFSIGARYSFGLQPYIKFTLPGGPTQEERNKSFQVFLRYELWKSKAKRG
jgi:hypothetical protein